MADVAVSQTIAPLVPTGSALPFEPFASVAGKAGKDPFATLLAAAGKDQPLAGDAGSAAMPAMIGPQDQEAAPLVGSPLEIVVQDQTAAPEICLPRPSGQPSAGSGATSNRADTKVAPTTVTPLVDISGNGLPQDDASPVPTLQAGSRMPAGAEKVLPPPPKIPQGANPVSAVPAAPEAPTSIAIASGSEPERASRSSLDGQSEDPLADAIAAGPTAVLALAPTMAPPAASAPSAAPAKADPSTRIVDRAAKWALMEQSTTGVSADTPLAPDQRADGKADRDAPAAKGRFEPPKSASTNLPEPAVGPRSESPEAQPNVAVGGPVSQDASSGPLPMPTPLAAPRTSDPAAPVQLQVPQGVAAAPRPSASGPRDTITAARHATNANRRRADMPASDFSFSNSPVDSAQRSAEPAQASLLGHALAGNGKGDVIVEQTLTIARDGAWLDALARDIVKTANNDGDLRFKLEPANLGSLTVAIAQSTEGASIHFTADRERTRDILVDAQPKLIAEARAQGLRVSDTQVDVRRQDSPTNSDTPRWTAGHDNQQMAQQNGQNRQSSPAHQPFVSNLGGKAPAEPESASDDSDALYA